MFDSKFSKKAFEGLAVGIDVTKSVGHSIDTKLKNNAQKRMRYYEAAAERYMASKEVVIVPNRDVEVAEVVLDVLRARYGIEV